jgi:hypothetical protein
LLLRENAVRLFKIFYRRYAHVLQRQNSGRREAIIGDCLHDDVELHGIRQRVKNEDSYSSQ